MTEGPSPDQHRHMHALWRTAEVTDRADRLALTSAFVGHRVRSSSDLTADEASKLISYMRHLDERGQLAEHAARWLAAHHATVPACPYGATPLQPELATARCAGRCRPGPCRAPKTWAAIPEPPLTLWSQV